MIPSIITELINIKKRNFNNSLFYTALFICLVFSTTVEALNNIAQKVSSTERQEIFEKFKELTKDYHSITATVHQEKQLLLLGEKVHIDGFVTMKKPNMLRWDIVKPAKSITVIDGKEMTVYHPEVKEAQVYTLSGNLIARNTMRFFSAALSGSLSELEKSFTINMFREDKKIVLKLIPLSRMARRYLSAIFIYYEEETGLPLGFEMTTPKGDKTVTRLSNLTVNPEIKPGTFKIELPEDVWITNSVEDDEDIWE